MGEANATVSQVGGRVAHGIEPSPQSGLGRQTGVDRGEMWIVASMTNNAQILNPTASSALWTWLDTSRIIGVRTIGISASESAAAGTAVRRLNASNDSAPRFTSYARRTVSSSSTWRVPPSQHRLATPPS